MLSRLWSRLPLFARLTIGVTLILVALAGLSFTVATRTEAGLAQAELKEHASSMLEVLPQTIAEWVVIGDYANVERTLRQWGKREHVRRIAWTDDLGGRIEVTNKADRLDVPDWFVRWLDIPSQHASRAVVIGGRGYGQVQVDMAADSIYGVQWQRFRLQMVSVIAAAGLMMLGILLILRSGLRPLAALDAGALALARGALADRIPSQGGPEFTRVIGTFNHMAESVKTAQEALQEAFERLAVTLSSIGDGVIATDLEGRVEFINPVAEALTGWIADEAKGRSVLQVFPIINEATREAVDCPVGRAIREGVAVGLANHTLLIARDGTERPIADSAAPIRHPDGRIVGAVLVFRDQTKERHTLDRLQLAASVFENALNGIAITDRDERIVEVNPAFTQITGYSREDAIGQTPRLLSSGRHDVAFFAAMWAEIGNTGQWRGEIWNRRKDGEVQPNEITIVAVKGLEGQVTHYIGVFRDLSQVKAQEARLEYLAYYDSLTGLPNRPAFERHLSQAIARAGRMGTWLAVGMIDLDDFKPVNDTFGHGAGDGLLRELAQRLQSRLRASDLLARLGGDEFVVVIEELDELQVIPQLSQAVRRLHQAVESPFEVAPGKQASVGMTLGLALFPRDAQTGDALLRQADAAMYLAKLHKHDRAQWWCLGAASAELPERETPFDAYAEETQALLAKTAGHFQAISGQFIAWFYAELAQYPHTQHILSALDAAELDALKQHQADHLRFLRDPATSREAIQQRAHRLGVSHALIGVGTGLLVQSFALYRRFLSQHLNASLLSSRERYRILNAMETRLQEDIQVQIEAGEATFGAYLKVLSAPLPPLGSLWPDVRMAELARLGELPGIQGVLLLRMDSAGVFAVEGSAGPQGKAIRAVLETPGLEAVIDPAAPRGQGLIGQAWRDRRILSAATFVHQARFQPWHAAAAGLGLRSVLSVPILGKAEHPVAIIGFYGAYPNQFESDLLQQFAQGVQQRWGQVWAHCAAPAPVIAEEHAQALRAMLFSGSLRLFMQPIVDLQSGHLTKVEALARLQQSNGQIVPPAVFLPLLGDDDLNLLFRQGLDIALGHLVRWDRQGLAIEVSVNLSPRTLQDSHCTQWVAAALQHHRVAPRRLTLELLETQLLDPAAKHRDIDALLKLGVKLAMDDLGSGYSSLQRLSTIPFDTVKVDQTLLSHIREHPVQTLSLIRAIVQMGHDFGRAVVVEGLEDAATIEAATLLGARYGQGYGLAEPMPADELVAWSRSFSLPGRSEGIQTFLGALAYHWQFIHGQDSGHPLPEQDCPLTRFLAERGLHDSEAAGWHRHSHEGPAILSREEASDRLVNWLVDQYRSQDG